MLDRIKAFFEDSLALDTPATGTKRSDRDDRAVRLASCALLLEMVRIDQESSVVEIETLRGAIQKSMNLSEAEVNELIEMAQAQLEQSNDYFQFTSLINERFTPAQKLEVIEAMWQIAYSDQTIDAHERHLMRKIASLLHIQHGDHMAAKARGQANAGASSD